MDVLIRGTIPRGEDFAMDEVRPRSHRMRQSSFMREHRWTILRALPLGVFLPMSVFFGSVGPDDFARNYANWAKKWGLDGWVDWLGQHATGPRVFWSAIFVTVIYVAIAFGLPSLIKHTKKNTATVVVPISVAFIVIGAVYGGHLIGLSGPNSAELTPDSLT